MLFLVVLIGSVGFTAADECNYDPAAPLKFHTEGKFILDQYGRAALLRGTNVPACYNYPFIFTTEDLDALKSFGFNFIRLPISWRYIEPEKGKYDLEHINDILNFIREAQKRGIYTMPDVHQVQWCKVWGQIPEWMCTALAEHGMDLGVIRRQTDRFWHSKELQAEFIGFWLFLIEHFRDEDGVAIYNILNEPFSIDGLAYGRFERCCLWPFYNDAIEAMRKADPDRPIALDPHPMTAVLPAWTGPLPYDNIIYAPHTYFPHGYGPKGLVVLAEESPEDVRKKYRRFQKDAEKMKTPWLVGEYGAVYPEKYPFVIPWFRENLRMQDRYFLGAAAWDYGPSGGGWNINTKEKKMQPYLKEYFLRPYPRYTAGRPEKLRYDGEKKEFRYRYVASGSCAPTEIFYPRELYDASDVEMGAVPPVKLIYDEEREVILIHSEGEGKVEIKISLSAILNGCASEE